MEPRIYQLYDNNAVDMLRPVSPTHSNWSAMMVPNPLDTCHVQPEDVQHETKFPVIQRSFAFDEWDDDEDNYDEVANFTSNLYNTESRFQPKPLAVISAVEHGRTIYDATQRLMPAVSNDSKDAPPSLNTYMTVTHLNDTVTSNNQNKAT
ncbi:MAG: hypothetical protein SGILL_005384, partial [Bacillariaceae sp.]